MAKHLEINQNKQVEEGDGEVSENSLVQQKCSL